jgi:hypothetical protein
MAGTGLADLVEIENHIQQEAAILGKSRGSQRISTGSWDPCAVDPRLPSWLRRHQLGVVYWRSTPRPERSAASSKRTMSNIIDKVRDVITDFRDRVVDDWIIETIGERFGVRYTDDKHEDALLDEGWKDKAEARARRKELLAGGAVDVRVVKITTRWRRRARKEAVEEKKEASGEKEKEESTEKEEASQSAEEK